MAIRYLPRKIIKGMLKKKKIDGLVSRDFNLNREALSFLSKTGVLSKGTLEDVALKVIKLYKKRYKEARKDGESITEATNDALEDKKLLVQRVQNASIHEMAKEIEVQYRGEYYEWLPSDSDEPDPEHQLKYGEVFQIGKGEMPGDRYGCKCGMLILVDETRLKL